MKPTLKAPGYKHLKLEHENLLSNFAFNFNLRRYNEEDEEKEANKFQLYREKEAEAGAYTRPLLSST